jgi:Fic family protein
MPAAAGTKGRHSPAGEPAGLLANAAGVTRRLLSQVAVLRCLADLGNPPRNPPNYMSSEPATFANVSAMEPLMPGTGVLREQAADLMRATARLEAVFHPVTQAGVAGLVQQMNSYYSNLIEGHQTHPVDIEKALNNQLLVEPRQRELQIEARAHVEVQRLIATRLDGGEKLGVCSGDFLRWVHREFCERLPPSFLIVKTTSGKEVPVTPGEFRTGETLVGSHFGPFAASLPRFIQRFEAYAPERHDPLDRIVAWAAAHHRLVWIHPFVDGNGRVARLFTDTYAREIGIGSSGLWSIARGLARQKDAYIARLADADSERRGALDGRGNLSQAALLAFCEFFLTTALDQVHFMAGLFELDTLQERILRFAVRWGDENGMPPSLGGVLREIALRGSVPRGEVAQMLDTSERTASRLIAKLLECRVVESTGHRDPLRLGFSTQTAGYYFPKLYPEGLA